MFFFNEWIWSDCVLGQKGRMEGECLNSGGMPGPSQVSYWGILFRVANIRKHSLLHLEVRVLFCIIKYIYDWYKWSKLA